MSSPFDLYKSRWWRFSSYELQGGYIRPAKDAKLEEYDPWEAYRESWVYDPESDIPFHQKREKNPPYQSLLALLDKIALQPDGNLTAESAKRLLGWCEQNGLLGILPQRVQIVTTAARWYPEYAWDAALGNQPEQQAKATLYHTQFQYYRFNAYDELRGWYSIRILGEPAKGKRLGQLVTGQSKTLTPGVLIQEMRRNQNEGFPTVIMSPEFFEEPFSETWARFFPDVPKDKVETYRYPLPLSNRFWELYSESIKDFLYGAILLRDAIAGLSNTEDKDMVYQSTKLFNNLVSSASIVMVPSEENQFQQEWRTPSLLGCFAVMALQDVTQQRRVLRCDNCNKPFVTEAYQARYCSDRCRRTAQKRRYRQKIKEELENDSTIKKSGRTKRTARKQTGQDKKKGTR